MCWRVQHCEPLSAAHYPGDDWPDEIKLAHGRYPEHEKLRAIADRSQVCGEFLDWLQHEKGYRLTERVKLNDRTRGDVEVMRSTEDLLGEFFCIDRDKLAAEKDLMVERMRTAQKAGA